MEVDNRDRGGTRARPATVADPIRVRSRPLLGLLRERAIERTDAMKIDVEGAEDTVLAPFFRDAPRTLWPAAILIEDSRRRGGWTCSGCSSVRLPAWRPAPGSTSCRLVPPI